MILRDHIAVKLREWSDAAVESVVAASGGTLDLQLPARRLLRVLIAEEDDERVLALLRDHPAVENVWCEHDHARPRALYAAQNDPVQPTAYHLIRHGFIRAWRYTTGNPAVGVGWTDQGTQTHGDVPFPDASHAYHAATGGSDPTDLAPWVPVDDNGFIADVYSQTGTVQFSHGLFTEGLVAATRNNSHGLSGVAPGCSFYFASIMNAQGAWPDLNCIAAMDWAVAQPSVRVINASWGGIYQKTSPTLVEFQEAIDAGLAAGKVFVFAAGNGNLDLSTLTGDLAVVSAPGGGYLTGQITVGACNQNDGRSDWTVETGDPDASFKSSYGAPVNIVAAGTWVWGATSNPFAYGCTEAQARTYALENGAYYAPHNGTSFAAPLVTGTLALIFSANPSLTVAEAKAILYSTTDASRDANFSTYFPNAGIVNAHKAVLKALTTVPANAGVRYPYLDAWGSGSTVAITGGVASNTLDGSIKIEVGGYSSDTITGVELWLGTDKLYDGPPTILNATASSTGTALPVKIVAKTAGGSTEESYTDVVVASLEVETVQDLPISLSNVLAFDASGIDRPALLPRNATLGLSRGYVYGGLASVLASSTFGVSTSFQPSATAQHIGSTAFASVLGMTLDAAQSIVGADVTLGAAILLAADAVSAQVGQSVYAQIIASSQDASYAPPGVSTGDVTVPHFLNMTLDAIQREVGNVTLGEALAVGMDADYEPVGHAHAREITLCGFYADAAFFHRIPLPGHGHYTPGRGGRQYSRQRGGADYTQRGDEKGYGEGE